MRLFDLSHLMDQSRGLQYITYLCIILLFSGSIYPICADPVTTDLVTELPTDESVNSTVDVVTELPTDESVNSTVDVSAFPFSGKLSNPCSFHNVSNFQGGAFRNTTRREKNRIIEYLRGKASPVKNYTESLLSTRLLLSDCRNLTIKQVAPIPTTEEILNSAPKAVLSLFYSSLLKHAAHVYFIVEQSKKYPEDPTCNPAGLRTNADSLANVMKIFLCSLGLNYNVFQDGTDEQDFHYPVEEVLIQLSDQPICSLRALSNCQAIRSTKSLTTAFLNYLNTLKSIFVKSSTGSSTSSSTESATSSSTGSATESS